MSDSKKVRVLQDYSFDERLAVKEVHVDFAISSDVLDAKKLIDELPITPNRAFSKGESYESKTFDPDIKQIHKVLRKRYTGVWGVNTKGIVESKVVEDHIKYLLALLEPHQEVIEQQYLSNPENYHIRFYIWWEPHDAHGDYMITSTTLRRMTDLCHEVEFCVIYNDEE